jgi:hypothetical protein
MDGAVASGAQWITGHLALDAAGHATTAAGNDAPGGEFLK